MMSFQGLDRYRTKSLKGDSSKKKYDYHYYKIIHFAFFSLFHPVVIFSRRNLKLYDSISSVWPAWVYEQYDPERLVKRMLEILSCHKAG